MSINSLKYFIDQSDEETIKRSVKVLLDELEDRFKSYDVGFDKISLSFNAAEKELRIGKNK